MLTKRYLYGEGIDEVLRATLPDKADLDNDSNTSELIDLYYHQNSLGSVVAVTDTAGNVAESYTYTAYGEETIYDETGTPTSGNVTLVEQPFMFTGRRWDFEEASGLYYYRLRYYDPVAGRFVSRDPLGLWGDPAQSGNGQSYCFNNPVNSRDPLGLTSEVLTSSNGLGGELSLWLKAWQATAGAADGRLGEVLAEAQRALKEGRVVQDDSLPAGRGGDYNPLTGRIRLAPSALGGGLDGVIDALFSLIHEAAHSLQWKEKAATGEWKGSSEIAREADARALVLLALRNLFSDLLNPFGVHPWSDTLLKVARKYGFARDFRVCEYGFGDATYEELRDKISDDLLREEKAATKPGGYTSTPSPVWGG